MVLVEERKGGRVVKRRVILSKEVRNSAGNQAIRDRIAQGAEHVQKQGPSQKDPTESDAFAAAEALFSKLPR